MAAASLFHLFFLSIISLSLASVNIDCGTPSGSSVDADNITWVGDENFITSGVSAIASSTTDKSLSTLRYFPTGETNCYTKIPVTKGGKVLVRTMFYYGNYDGKSSYPTFNVMIDGKHGDAVTLSSVADPSGFDLIFSADGGEISVCFVRTSDSNPFVSSIEVVDLAAGMYDELGPGEGLICKARFSYGSTRFIRSDAHGRFWYPSGPSPSISELTSTAATIDISDASNKPPESILRNCWSGEGLKLGPEKSITSVGVPVYLALYFSNPVESDFRSFNIFFSGRQVNKDPVMPVFGKATQIVVRDLATSSSMVEFRSTVNTISPPLINALEFYVITKNTSRGGGPGTDRGGVPETGRGFEGNSGGDKSSNLKLLGIAVPVCVFGAVGYGVWRWIIKPRRHHKSTTGHEKIEQNVNVNVAVGRCCC